MTMLVSHIVYEGASLAQAQRGRPLIARLTVLLSLADLGLTDARAIAQEFRGMHRWGTAIGSTVLTSEEEKVKAAKPGSEFTECASACPVMVVIPAGNFMMGSPESGSPWDLKHTPPVGSLTPNAFWLHDMHGNVWEWVEDTWHQKLRRRADGRIGMAAGWRAKLPRRPRRLLAQRERAGPRGRPLQSAISTSGSILSASA